MSSNERAAAIGGSALLAVVAALTAIRVAEDETTGYAAGYAVGVVIAAVLLALVLRWVWVKLRGRGDVASGWLALLAALLAMGLSIANAARDTNEDNERETERIDLAGDECVAAQPAPVTDGGGIRFRELNEVLRAQVLATAPPTVPTDDVVLRQAVIDGAPSGVAFAYPGIASEADRDGFMAGLTGTATADGFEVSDAELAGAAVKVVSFPAGIAIAGFNGCYAWVVQARTRVDAQRVAERILAS